MMSKNGLTNFTTKNKEDCFDCQLMLTKRFFYRDALKDSWFDNQICWSGIDFMPKDYY